jgi:DtxR family Mn-dependent transcriptional regulator
MAPTAQLSSSLEDYLEAILHLQDLRAVARAKEIGTRLKVNRSSVTAALHALARKGLIHYAPYDFITLTGSGRRLARDVARRHQIMRQFLIQVLCIDPAQADPAACRLEHALDGVVLERLTSFLEFANRCPMGKTRWRPHGGFRCDPHDRSVRAPCSQCAADRNRKKKRSPRPSPGGRVASVCSRCPTGSGRLRTTVRTLTA